MRFVMYVDTRINDISTMKTVVEASNWLSESDRILYLARYNGPNELVVIHGTEESTVIEVQP